MRSKTASIRIAAGVMLAVLAGTGASTAASAASVLASEAAHARGSQAILTGKDEIECGTGLNAAPTSPRKVNLVLDDSGSMFNDGKKSLTRWSMAKYSLEVFASMMDKNDTLNVYRMSDFAEGKSSGPKVVLKGDEPASQRVAQIHDMHMQGGGTPYRSVKTAMADLRGSKVAQRWLVILSDGEFDDEKTGALKNDLVSFVKKNSSESAGMRVAFMGIGPAAPKLSTDRGAGIYYEKAPKSADLLEKMTAFSNRIFAKSELEQTSLGQVNPDVDLDQILVFAQGKNVKLGNVSAGKQTIKPVSTVEVAWSTNPDANFNGGKEKALPDKTLKGKLATYENVPAGTSAIDVTGAQGGNVDVFYTPHAAFGIELRDDKGEKVANDKAVGGDYTVNYGFMNKKCEIIESDLFGDVSYTAELSQGGKTIAKAFKPGDKVTLERGEAQFTVAATYLGGNTSRSTIDLNVLRPAKPTAFEAEKKTYEASKLTDYDIAEDAQQLHYFISENGKDAEFSAEEWATFTSDSFTAKTSVEDISFDIEPGEQPGEVLLLPKAPGGDPYKAATGEIPVTVKASHVYDEQLSTGTGEVKVQIDDDFSWWERALNWFMTVGWKWLIVLVAVVWLIGYFVRPTFPRNIKAKPLVTFQPKKRGRKGDTYPGKFVKDRLGALIPYRARTAKLTYAQGFPQMQLRAKRGRKAEIVNWKALAQRESIEINGEPLNKESTKSPFVRGATSISATDNEGTHSVTLSVSG